MNEFTYDDYCCTPYDYFINQKIDQLFREKLGNKVSLIEPKINNDYCKGDVTIKFGKNMKMIYHSKITFLQRLGLLGHMRVLIYNQNEPGQLIIKTYKWLSRTPKVTTYLIREVELNTIK